MTRVKAKELPALEPGDQFWIRDHVRYSLVTKKTGKPQFYLVTTERGTLQQNQSALVAAAKPAETEQHSVMQTGNVNLASPVHVTTTDSCVSSYPRNNTGRVRTSKKSKPRSPDNSVRKNCEASRTLESLVEH